MPRRADEKKVQVVVELLHARPGRRPGEYARMMGCHREAFVRVLAQLERAGVLLAEDGDGRLWPVERAN